MKNSGVLVFLFWLMMPLSANAQSSHGAEIVSYQTFGEGLMVTRAKMVPISGTVSNIFFYNRADEPWNGNVWFEYDWELRGAHPENGWSQIRVRQTSGGQLRDAPENTPMTENLGDKILHYILVRQGNQYVYDVRESFDIASYNYTVASAHGGNSASIIAGGPRVFFTGGSVSDIPSSQRLDFSLGVTAFDNGWAGRLPSGEYSGDYAIDFTRFYEFSGGQLQTSPSWSDEFNGNSLDTSKWFAATWTFQDTQFTPQNVRFENGYMILRVDRDDGPLAIGGANLAASGQASQSSTAHGGSAVRAIDGNAGGFWGAGSVTHTKNESNAWWQVELASATTIGQIVIHNREDSCCVERLSEFSVSVLDDDGDVVWTQFYTEAPRSALRIDLNVVGKAVRVNLDGVLSLAEVEVYGAEGDTPGANLATAGVASQSSLAHGGVPSRGIDGNTNGAWKNSSVTHTQNAASSWWQVALEQVADIDRIVLHNRTDSCCTNRLSNYTVSVLDENGNVVWSEVYANPPSSSRAIDLSVRGKVVRVSVPGTLSLAEVQVFGTVAN